MQIKKRDKRDKETSNEAMDAIKVEDACDYIRFSSGCAANGQNDTTFWQWIQGNILMVGYAM